MAKSSTLLIYIILTVIAVSTFYFYFSFIHIEWTWNKATLESSTDRQGTQCNLDPDKWTPDSMRYLPAHLADTHQEDPRLIKHIEQCWIMRPSGRPQHLENTKLSDYSQVRITNYDCNG